MHTSTWMVEPFRGYCSPLFGYEIIGSQRGPAIKQNSLCIQACFLPRATGVCPFPCRFGGLPPLTFDFGDGVGGGESLL